MEEGEEEGEKTYLPAKKTSLQEMPLNTIAPSFPPKTTEKRDRLNEGFADSTSLVRRSAQSQFLGTHHPRARLPPNSSPFPVGLGFSRGCFLLYPTLEERQNPHSEFVLVLLSRVSSGTHRLSPPLGRVVARGVADRETNRQGR